MRSLGSAAVGALAARGASPTPGPIRRRWRGAPASEPSTELLGRFVLRSGGCPAMVSKALASSTWPSFRATLMGDQPSLFTHSGSAEADCTKYWHVALWPAALGGAASSDQRECNRQTSVRVPEVAQLLIAPVRTLVNR